MGKRMMKSESTFLKRMTMLRKAGWSAKLNKTECIRLRAPEESRYIYCPITALVIQITGRHWPITDPRLPAKAANIGYELCISVIAAADYPELVHHRTFRKRMMSRLGIEVDA